MKRLLHIGFALFTGLAIGVGCNSKSTSSRQMVWADEFDYKGLPDTNRWNYDTIGNATGWGNNELQCYTVANKANAWADGEVLRIRALKEGIGLYDYTSARLTTKHKGDWLYGRIEVRAKMAAGRGIWPAIWMLPTDWEYGGWPKSGEIDILEHVGYLPDSVFCTVHTGKFNHAIGTQVGKSVYLPDSETQFHVYAIDWKANEIEFEIDGKKVFRFENTGNGPGEWPFDKRFHLLLNVAVGGNWGGLKGVDQTIFPATMEVDYVRVYK